MRYVLKRKSDGLYYSTKGYSNSNKWQADLQKAWVYKQKGGPKNTLYGLGWLPYKQGVRTQTPKERLALKNKLFAEQYEILTVELKIVG
jgi:hypothetical protein